MVSSQLNLTRKFRSKTFDEVVGQDLAVKMLKNSLYLNHLLPVYLFAGQRGCGKTSMARIFAAAVNCEQLDNFRKRPKEVSIPCLTCESCQAVSHGQHPDFIEIDAASHTGVDNVRQIIDAASLLPLMGRKKIYLIDEAHMLSKAAFNALLKMLEEPPARALFMLATTDANKVLDTVRSRCFQLFFKAVPAPALINHIKFVLDTEKIGYEMDGVRLIVNHTHGSVRDALNLIEQVRFAAGTVTKQSVLDVLGYIDDEQLVSIIQHIAVHNATGLIQYIDRIGLRKSDATYIWYRLAQLARAGLWLSYSQNVVEFNHIEPSLRSITAKFGGEVYTRILQALYSHESLFLKTQLQYEYLEMVLIVLATKSTDSGTSSEVRAQAADVVFDDEDDIDEEEDDDADDDVQEVKNHSADIAVPAMSVYGAQWDLFMKSVEQLNDPLLHSIFKQVAQVEHDVVQSHIVITFLHDSAFFKEWLENTKTTWSALLNTAFIATLAVELRHAAQQPVAPVARTIKIASPVSVQAQTSAIEKKANNNNNTPAVVKSYSSSPRQTYRKQNSPVVRGTLLDVSETRDWPITHTVLHYFPGIVTELPETHV